MNEYKTNLYNNLLNLANTNEAFFYKDYQLDHIYYRIFLYRLASYNDFLAPDALESRGIMFRIHEDEQPLELVSLPMNKFFNDSENPFTMGLDYSTIDQVMLKMDGSLMSTYLHNDKLMVKSKGALFSEHAINAMKWLDREENSRFKEELEILTSWGYTINMEYTSPEPNMRIVIGYQEPKLTVLNIRNTDNGKYLSFISDLHEAYTQIREHWVDVIKVDNGIEFMNSISDMTGIEGYVIRLKSGQFVKKKTKWYSALHHTKDSINNPRRLFECCLEETVDDLKSMFADDQYSISKILEMETFVSKTYNHLVKTSEDFYYDNKYLERKEFAIKAKSELTQKEFSIVMLLYSGKDFSYKDLMKKWYKDYGFVDASVVTEE